MAEIKNLEVLSAVYHFDDDCTEDLETYFDELVKPSQEMEGKTFF